MVKADGIEADRLIAALQARLAAVADPAKRDWWRAYLKGAVDFRGVGIPEIRSEVAAWRVEQGVDRWPVPRQFDLAISLLGRPLAEDKLAGVLFMQVHLLEDLAWRPAVAAWAGVFERGWIHDWSTCDWFCVRVIGPTIARRGPACARAVAGWARAENLWHARASVVGFVPVAGDRAHHGRALEASARLLRRPERFAGTAVGWLLREIRRHDAAAADRFIEANLRWFSIEALRNALKHAPASLRDAQVAALKRAGGPGR